VALLALVGSLCGACEGPDVPVAAQFASEDPCRSAQCDDGNVCTVDTCIPAVGCANEATATGCDDANLCTGPDVCVDKVCKGSKDIDCEDGDACTDHTCLSASGCKQSHNTSKCDDDNECTLADVCEKGKCAGPDPRPCVDGNVCTDDGCDPKTGCLYANNEGDCNDGDQCTKDDYCMSGGCVPGVKKDCEDDNECTTDTCNKGQGCVWHVHGDPCDDKDKCTTKDVCNAGACAGTKISCDDKDPCTVDSCSFTTGCENKTAADGTSCGDKKTCKAGICQSG